MAERPFVIPAELARTAAEVQGAAGLAWLDRLPATVAECARRWSLAVGPPFARLSYNYAAPAVRADGRAAVLKVFLPGGEFRAEAEALRLFDGRGAARLLAADLDRGALLLERLEPGTPLTEIADAAETAAIAAGVMRRLWRPAPPDHPFPSVADWVRGMAERAPRLAAAGGPVPAGWLDEALTLFAGLDAAGVEPVLLHGDLHPGNVLAAGREPWLAIDQKGVVGELAAEPGALLLNLMPQVLAAPRPGRALARLVDQLAAELGLDRERLQAWSVVRAVLADFWAREDHGRGWEAALACAELLAARGGGG